MTRRFGPNHRDGLKKVHVGCGPRNHLPEWWNVDLRKFAGVDEVLDVTQLWPWSELEYIFGEHFLEHLTLEQAVRFLVNAGNSLRQGGVIRLSTPNLEWVLLTHFSREPKNPQHRVLDTLKMNRAFHGWGHQFLYTKEMLAFLLAEMKFADVTFYSYGESAHPELRNLEKHGNFHIHGGHPSVIIVEARRGREPIVAPERLSAFLHEHYIRYTASGH